MITIKQEQEVYVHDISYMIPSTKCQYEKDDEKTLLQADNEGLVPSNARHLNSIKVDHMRSNMESTANCQHSISTNGTVTPVLTMSRKHVPIQLYDNPSPTSTMVDLHTQKSSIHRKKSFMFRSKSFNNKKQSSYKSIFHKVKIFFTYSNKKV
ncbi:hypothetical protein INT46_002401 [Mucor plumbeus]|uniref:Uncharacterized protein n=1 Tax=Mucor plumbeus TaxID=97098 RepID=A0A8H7QCU3_9FUNG|nr:hypothetical protein INT46_002401 [Mucor plumbeus]